jgi:hypothetical protein
MLNAYTARFDVMKNLKNFAKKFENYTRPASTHLLSHCIKTYETSVPGSFAWEAFLKLSPSTTLIYALRSRPSYETHDMHDSIFKQKEMEMISS